MEGGSGGKGQGRGRGRDRRRPEDGGGAGRGRGGKAGGSGGSGAFPQAKYLNMVICKAADRGDMQSLLNLVAENHADMSCVNLSTAMHKLARFLKEDSRMMLPAGDKRFEALHMQIRAELERQVQIGLTRGGTSMRQDDSLPRCWSTLSWAYGTMQIRGLDTSAIFDLITQLALAHLPAFKPLELTNLLWGFAKVRASSAALFKAAHKHILADLSPYSSSNLSTLVWATVTAQQHEPALVQRLVEEFAVRLPTSDVKPVELTNLMWGLATAKLHPKAHVLDEVGKRALQLISEFKLQELSITCWAFSRLNARYDRFFAGAVLHLRSSPKLLQQIHPQGMANLLWAFEKQTAIGSSAAEHLIAALTALIPRCASLLKQFKPQEFACVFRALSRMGMRWGTCPDADMLLVSAASVGLALLRRLSAPQCIDLLAAFATFLHVPCGGVPDVFSTFLDALVQRCLDNVPDLGHSGAMHLVEVAAGAVALLGEQRNRLAGLLARLVLRLNPDRFSAAGQKVLAGLCGLPSDEIDAAALRSALSYLAAVRHDAASAAGNLPDNAGLEWRAAVQQPRGRLQEDPLEEIWSTADDDSLVGGQFLDVNDEYDTRGDLGMRMGQEAPRKYLQGQAALMMQGGSMPSAALAGLAMPDLSHGGEAVHSLTPYGAAFLPLTPLGGAHDMSVALAGAMGLTVEHGEEGPEAMGYGAFAKQDLNQLAAQHFGGPCEVMHFQGGSGLRISDEATAAALAAAAATAGPCMSGYGMKNTFMESVGKEAKDGVADLAAELAAAVAAATAPPQLALVSQSALRGMAPIPEGAAKLAQEEGHSAVGEDAFGPRVFSRYSFQSSKAVSEGVPGDAPAAGPAELAAGAVQATLDQASLRGGVVVKNTFIETSDGRGASLAERFQSEPARMPLQLLQPTTALSPTDAALRDHLLGQPGSSRLASSYNSEGAGSGISGTGSSTSFEAKVAKFCSISSGDGAHPELRAGASAGPGGRDMVMASLMEILRAPQSRPAGASATGTARQARKAVEAVKERATASSHGLEAVGVEPAMGATQDPSCYVVKNTFIEAAGAEGSSLAATVGSFRSEPPKRQLFEHQMLQAAKFSSNGSGSQPEELQGPQLRTTPKGTPKNAEVMASLLGILRASRTGGAGALGLGASPPAGLPQSVPEEQAGDVWVASIAGQTRDCGALDIFEAEAAQEEAQQETELVEAAAPRSQDARVSLFRSEPPIRPSLKDLEAESARWGLRAPVTSESAGLVQDNLVRAAVQILKQGSLSSVLGAASASSAQAPQAATPAPAAFQGIVWPPVPTRAGGLTERDMLRFRSAPSGGPGGCGLQGAASSEAFRAWSKDEPAYVLRKPIESTAAGAASTATPLTEAPTTPLTDARGDQRLSAARFR